MQIAWRGSATIKIAALIAVAVTLLIAGLVPWPMPRGKVQRALAFAFRAGGGTSLNITGRTTFTILPLPHVTVRDLKLDYRNGTMRAVAQEASIGLDALALLTWRVVPRNALLSNFEIQTPSSADSPLDLFRGLFLIGSSERILPDLDWIAVRDGRLQMASQVPENGTIEQLSALWTPGPNAGPFDLSLSGNWRGETLSLAITGPSLALSSQVAKSEATLQLSSRLLNLNFNGHLLGGSSSKVDGQIEASSLDAVALMAWLAVPQPLPGRLDQVRIKGDITASGPQFALSNARFSMNGDQYDGVFGLRVDGMRPALNATLAAETADLTDQFQFLIPRRNSDGNWSQERYESGTLEVADVDLRLSARRLTVGSLKMDRAAISLLLRSQRLEITLAEAMISGGAAKGRVVILPSSQGIDIRGQAAVDQVDFGDLLFNGLGLRRLNGRGSLSTAFEASGDSTEALANTLDGHLNLSVSDGELLGIDLDRLLLRLERRSLVAALEIPTGKTSFDAISLDVAIAHGRFEINQCSLKSRTLDISLSGRTAIPNRLLDFSGVVASNEQSGRNTKLPFMLRGTWDAPKFSPQPDSARPQL